MMVPHIVSTPHKSIGIQKASCLHSLWPLWPVDMGATSYVIPVVSTTPRHRRRYRPAGPMRASLFPCPFPPELTGHRSGTRLLCLLRAHCKRGRERGDPQPPSALERDVRDVLPAPRHHERKSGLSGCPQATGASFGLRRREDAQGKNVQRQDSRGNCKPFGEASRRSSGGRPSIPVHHAAATWVGLCRRMQAGVAERAEPADGGARGGRGGGYGGEGEGQAWSRRGWTCRAQKINSSNVAMTVAVRHNAKDSHHCQSSACQCHLATHLACQGAYARVTLWGGTDAWTLLPCGLVALLGTSERFRIQAEGGQGDAVTMLGRLNRCCKLCLETVLAPGNQARAGGRRCCSVPLHAPLRVMGESAMMRAKGLFDGPQGRTSERQARVRCATRGDTHSASGASLHSCASRRQRLSEQASAHSTEGAAALQASHGHKEFRPPILPPEAGRLAGVPEAFAGIAGGVGVLS